MKRIDRRAQRGVTMVEVLIAVLVLTAGLIGLAGLQGVSLHNSYSAYERSQAVSLAYEVLDRIRASRACTSCDGSVAAHEAWGDNEAAARLTQGDLRVATNGTIVTVTVRWLDDRLQENTDDKFTELAFSSRI